MPNALTGPASFTATLTKYTGEVVDEAEHYTFDASDAVTKPAQRALFADYTAQAKELGYKLPRAAGLPRRIQYTDGGPQFVAPRFTAVAMSANERQWLGREVGFRPANANAFSPVGDGVCAHGSDIIHGTVWSLSPYPKAFWVYVPGQGFYSVAEAKLLTGVNA